MKYLFLLCILCLPYMAHADTAIEPELEKQLQQISQAEDIFFLRISILQDRLDVLESELWGLEDSYKKTLVTEEIKMITENIAREKKTLERRVYSIIHGEEKNEVPPLPQTPQRGGDIQNYFKHFQR